MNHKRLKFEKGEQAHLLKEFAKLSGTSQIDTASILGVPRRTYRNWLSERTYLPALVFDTIVGAQPMLARFKESVIETKDANWGQKVGGKKAIAKIISVYGSDEMRKRQVSGGRKSVKRRLEAISKRMPSLSNPGVSEFLGALMGDGWIGEYGRRKQVAICGNLKELQYARHLIRLSKKIFGIKPYLFKRKDSNAFYLFINNSVVFNYIRANFNFPKGEKSVFDTGKLPTNWELQKCVIRGLFDTDGSVYFDKAKGYKHPYPTVEVASKNRELLDWLNAVLRQNHYATIPHKRGLRVKGIADVRRWFAEISPQNKRKVQKYEKWAELYHTGP